MNKRVVWFALILMAATCAVAGADSGTGYSNTLTIDNRTAAGVPAAYNVQSPQGKHFIPGMPGTLTFSATVSWNGSPGTVYFNINGGRYQGAITDLGGGNAQAQVTVPAPSAVTQCSEITVDVTNSAGKKTTAGTGLFFHPMPDMIASWYGTGIPWTLSGGKLNCSGEASFTFWDVSIPSGVLETKASLGITKELTFDPFAGTFDGSRGGTGTFNMTAEFQHVESINEGSLQMPCTLKVGFAGCNPPSVTPGWNVSVSGKSGIGAPAVLVVDAIFPAAAPAINSVLNVPVLGDVLGALKLRIFLTGGGAMSGEYLNNQTGSCFLGATSLSGSYTLGLEGQIAVKPDHFNGEVGVYAGGTGTPSVQLCPDLKLTGVTFRAYVGVFASYWLFDFKQEVGTQVTLGDSGRASARVAAADVQSGKTASQWEPIGNSYLRYGEMNREAAPSAPIAMKAMSSTQSGGSSETTVVQNVTKLSGPSILASSQGTRMVYTLFDPNKPWYAATDVASVFGTGSPWSQERVTDDQLAEFSPKLAAVDTNNALAAWTRVTGDMSGTTEPSQVAPYLDIVATHLNRQTGVWSAPVQLTTNGVVDRDPLPVVFGSTQGIIWVQNEANASLGNATNGDRLMYSGWSGSAWSTPQVLWSAKKGIIATAFVADGSGQGHAVFAVDEDGDLDTTTDRELYQIATSGDVWGAATRITNDTVEDSLPTLVAPNGTPICVWNAGGTLKYSNLNSWNPKTVYSEYTISNEAATLDGVTMPGGAAIAYAVQLPTGVDIVASFYDASLDIWSLPRQLTNDADVETALSLGYDGTQLVIGYLKNRTVRGPVDVEIDGVMQHLEDIPQPSQTDLCILRHTLGSDLAVGTITVAPVNPVPGTSATITATVENRGDLPEAGIDVVFFDGDPLSSGIQIGSTQNIAGPLLAGKSTDVSVSWSVPVDGNAHRLYVVVDRDLSVDDRDRSNNTGNIWVLTPDIAVDTPQLVGTAGTQMIVQSKLSNISQYPAPAVPWEIRLNNASGTLLGSGTTDPVVAGASTIISATFDTSGLSGQSATIYVVADPQQTITDSDRSNNVSTSVVDLLPDIAVNQGSASVSGNNVTLTLSNQGVRETGSFVVRATGDNSLVLGQATVTSILPGNQVDVTVPVTPGLVYTGITLTADPDGVVVESRTDNNSTFVMASNYATIPAARTLADGTKVSLSDKVVTASLGDSFYMEETNRSGGIKVIWATPPAKDLAVTVTGQLSTQGVEKVIFADSVTTGLPAEVKPIGIVQRNVGGHLGNPVWLGFVDGPGMTSVYNLGLLMRSWGTVTYVDPAGAFAYVDDGSALNDGNTLGASGAAVLGVKIILPSGVSMPPVGNMVILTGVASSEMIGVVSNRLLRVRMQSDISLASGAVISGKVTQGGSQTINQIVECPHNYPNNYNNTWTITGPTGTTSMRVHFTQIALETNYDYLRVQNSDGTTQQTYNSNYTDTWSNWVTGNTIKLNMTSDGSVVYYGFQMDQYQAQVPNTPTAGVTVTLMPGLLTATTGVDGTFSFSSLSGGTYTVTPSLSGATFTPASRSVTVSNGQYVPGNDFVKN